MPFHVEYRDVADRDLGPLLAHGSTLGYTNPSVVPVTAAASELPPATVTGDQPTTQWRLVNQRENQAYQWPKTVEHYYNYSVYVGQTEREGSVYISLGWTSRPESWGRDRTYTVAFLTQGAPQTPLVEFLATDDHAETGEMLAVIRGRDGASRMYGPSDALPPVYVEHFRTEVYRDRVPAPRAFNK